MTCPNQKQSALQNYDAHTRPHTHCHTPSHTHTHPLRRSGVLQRTEILSAAKWPTLGYLSTHPVCPAFVHRPAPLASSLLFHLASGLTRTHTHTGWTINRPASCSSSCARSAQPRNQLTGNFNYFTGCVRHAKWPEPNVNTIRQCHTGQACSAHEIINSRRGGEQCTVGTVCRTSGLREMELGGNCDW